MEYGSFSPQYYHWERTTIINAIKNTPTVTPCKLIEIVDFIREKTKAQNTKYRYIGMASVESGTGELSNEIESASGDAFVFKKGDILYGKLRPYLNKVWLATFDGICSTEFHVLRLKTDIISSEMLTEILLSNIVLKQTVHMMTGNTHPRISDDDVKKLLLPIPKCTDSVKEEINYLLAKKTERNEKIKKADNLIAISKKQLFESLGIDLPPFVPTIFSCVKSKELLSTGWYCNSHSFYLDDVFRRIKESSYYAGTLEDYAYINPSINKSSLTDSTPVSFVPMNAVSEKTNSATYETTEYSNVKTGFTSFEKNDLLWAKITPCMQNGKSFFAGNLPTQYGFASTEFHVVRAKNDDIYMPFLWCILSNDSILEAAQGMFSGSAGQQRVSETFLKKLPIALPSMEVQKELADNVMNALEESKKLRNEAEQEWQAAKAQFEKELLGE